MTATCDILMVTHDRPDYVRLSLPRLLETCDDDAAVWLWHNGEHAETLRLVREFAEHPKVTRFHHSIKNVQLREPTNWLLGNSTADLLGKVDDDNLMPMGWLDKLRDTHAADWSLACVGCWPFRVEDIDEAIAGRKVVSVGDGRVMLNCWVGGTGFLMKQEAVEAAGLLDEGESFPAYCVRLCKLGFRHGWRWPVIAMGNFDDPRDENAGIRTDADFAARPSLSMKSHGVHGVADLIAYTRKLALDVQKADPDWRRHVGWRGKLHNVGRRVRRARARLLSHA